jgi:hypothetical protein
VVESVETGTLQPQISRKVSIGSTICRIPGRPIQGLQQEGMFIVSSIMERKQYSDGSGNHINGLEEFGMI